MNKFFGVELLPDSPIFEYMARLMWARYAGIGIFFIILGLRPIKCGILVPFSALASMLLGTVTCAIPGAKRPEQVEENYAAAMPVLQSENVMTKARSRYDRHIHELVPHYLQIQKRSDLSQRRTR